MSLETVPDLTLGRIWSFLVTLCSHCSLTPCHLPSPRPDTSPPRRSSHSAHTARSPRVPPALSSPRHFTAAPLPAGRLFFIMSPEAVSPHKTFFFRLSERNVPALTETLLYRYSRLFFACVLSFAFGTAPASPHCQVPRASAGGMPDFSVALTPTRLGISQLSVSPPPFGTKCCVQG